MNSSSENPELQIHDPKLVPFDGELVSVNFSQKELRQLEKARRKEGCWSIEEYMRLITAKVAQARRKRPT